MSVLEKGIVWHWASTVIRATLPCCIGSGNRAWCPQCIIHEPTPPLRRPILTGWSNSGSSMRRALGSKAATAGYGPRANTQALQHQLDDLGRTLASQLHALLVLDGAGWYHSVALVIPDNLTLLHLSTCSPELNLAERLWRKLRQRHLSNHVYPDIEALDDAVTTAWLALTRDTDQLRQLTYFPWIQFAQAQVN